METMTEERKMTLVIVAGITFALLAFSYITTGDLGDFAITIMSGLFQGMLLFLVASGLSIVFGLMDILNFAQGAFFMIGAYIGYEIHHATGLIDIIPDPNIRFVISLMGATLIGAIMGWFLERVLLRPLYVRPLFQLVLTFGVAIIMLEAVKSIWGVRPRNWTDSFSILESSFTVFGQQFTLYRPFVVVVGIVLIISIALLLNRTRIGIIIRAGVEDAEMVEALGINVRAVFTLVFTLGSAVAALGGGVAAPFLGANLELGNAFLLAAIAVVVLGGLGSYEGTAIASILVGLSVAVVAKFATQYINQPVWASITPMIVLVVILLIRPSGLFGKER